jgi:TonB-dependent receptor
MINRTLRPISAAVAIANASLMMPVLAQTDPAAPGESQVADSPLVMEEVIVTGIRQSLERSMDVKRDAQGVVDAITAEDIGKFPDTNLAESLQRITGVSIDRVGGEGQRVTVRGFGGDFNLVTLNGRLMPTANLGIVEASPKRSFDFATLASESIRAVEVFKTGKADLVSGGVGSTINIQTFRPLDKPGLTASVSGNALMDTTNEEGDDITPEFSGIYANSFFDDTVGIAISGSYSERDYREAIALVPNGWNTAISDGTEFPGFSNAPGAGDVYGIAQNSMYQFNDVERERTNGQLTLQWEPVQSLRGTLDYTYSELEYDTERQELSAWFFTPVSGEFAGKSGGVFSPLLYTDTSCCDIALGVGGWGTTNETESLGFNIEWNPTESLSLAFDYHDSSAEAKAKNDQGTNNVAPAASYTRAVTTVDYRPDFPSMVIDSFEGGAPGPETILGSGLSYRNSYQKTDIEQFRFDGVFELEEEPFGLRTIDFGLNYAEVENRSAYGSNDGGDWGGGSYVSTGDATDGDLDNVFDDSSYALKNLRSEFDELNGDANAWYYDVNYNQHTRDLRAFYETTGTQPQWLECRGDGLCAPNTFVDDRRLKEENTAVYAQLHFYFEPAGMPVNLTVGLRYDDTDVSSSSKAPNYNTVLWQTANELLLRSEGSTFLKGDGGYDYWLPNVDVNIEPVDDVVLRASYSETITRANYDQLQGGASIGAFARTDTISTGTGGDTGLDPFESENFDFSAEWYYAEGSYVSVGYYLKKVDNFIGTTVNVVDLYPALVQPASGPRYAEALDNVVDDPLKNTQLQVLEYYQAQGWVDPDTGELLNGLDSYGPLLFNIEQPINSEDAEIDGFELAVQHMFGDSGFGVIANYTTVDGDIEYDNNTIGQPQFALLGLSDSYNLIGFYDKNGIQARLAYNWRDDFLDATTQVGKAEPIYVEEYSQLDLSVSYTWNEQLTIFGEAINLTDEDVRKHGRTRNMLWSAEEGGARYAIGVRYAF